MRANGVAYRGINTIMLWSEAVTRGHASTITKTGSDAQSGEDIERVIPFMKGCMVFNVE